MEYLFKALESAIESAAEQRQAATPPRPQQRDPRPKPQPKVVKAAPAPAPLPEPQLAPLHDESQLDGGLVPLFEDGKSIIRALVAAEVLGPPVAMREPSTWSLRPNEPSI
ncbi:MAG: hypothetical protein JO165_13250 [Candidatus Eremiobacteraeota bacterium]|nr:hypothetical protein [Candidatus Eremiobacteraeota bacterium]